MNEELQKKLLDYANNAESFLSAEVPLFFQEFITYHWYSSLVLLIIHLGAILTLIGLLVSWYRYLGNVFKKYNFDSDNAFGLTMLISIVVGIGILINTLSASWYVEKFIKISVAPRVFVVDCLRK